MPTLDFAQDIIELFQKNHKEYLIVVVQSGKRKKLHTFYKIDSEETSKLVGNSLHYIAENIMGTPPQGANSVIIDKPKKRNK